MAAIQLAEQTLLNAAVLTVSATATTALAGVVFNALLITRAPLQLFQSIQTSLLPHLAGLEATEGHEAFARAIRVTVLAIAAFAGAVALGLLLIGPWAMDVVFGHGYDYGRVGLAVIAVGMGFHLVRGHAQPGRAGPRPRPRGGGDVAGRAPRVFVVWMVAAGRRRRAGARRGRLRGRGGAAVRAAVVAVPAVAPVVRCSVGGACAALSMHHRGKGRPPRRGRLRRGRAVGSHALASARSATCLSGPGALQASTHRVARRPRRTTASGRAAAGRFPSAPQLRTPAMLH